MQKTRRREFLKVAGCTAIGATSLMEGVATMRAQEKPDMTTKDE